MSNINILDLKHFDIPILKEDSYHPSISLTLSTLQQKGISLPRNDHVYDYSKGDFCLLYNLLRDVDWSDLQVIEDVNVCVDLFYKKMYECLDQAIPEKMVKRDIHKGSGYPVYTDG